MTREEMIDLLRSLSRIDGVAMQLNNQVIIDELEWITELLINKLKEETK